MLSQYRHGMSQIYCSSFSIYFHIYRNYVAPHTVLDLFVPRPSEFHSCLKSVAFLFQRSQTIHKASQTSRMSKFVKTTKRTVWDGFAIYAIILRSFVARIYSTCWKSKWQENEDLRLLRGNKDLSRHIWTNKRMPFASVSLTFAAQCDRGLIVVTICAFTKGHRIDDIVDSEEDLTLDGASSKINRDTEHTMPKNCLRHESKDVYRSDMF